MDAETQIPFDPERIFKREPSAEQASQEEMRPTDRSIRQIIPQNDAQVLEAGVAQAVQVLQSMKLSFQWYAEHHDARAWIEAIEKLTLKPIGSEPASVWWEIQELARAI